MHSPPLSQKRPAAARGFVPVARNAVTGFLSDRCTTLGASIAFYAAFSLAPTLLTVLAVAGWFFGKDAAQGRLFGQIKDITGPEAASAMQPILNARRVGQRGGPRCARTLEKPATRSMSHACDIAKRFPKGWACH